MSSTTLLLVITAVMTVVGIPFTLWWWKLADRWADAEHKRFKPPPDTRGKVVIRDTPEPPPDPPAHL